MHFARHIIHKHCAESRLNPMAAFWDVFIKTVVTCCVYLQLYLFQLFVTAVPIYFNLFKDFLKRWNNAILKTVYAFKLYLTKLCTGHNIENFPAAVS